MSTQASTGDKSIRSDAATYEALRQLAKEHQLSNTKLLAAMVQYFRVTKADPQQPKAPDLTSSLAQLSEKLDKLDKRTIGFIREQEKQYLKPILAEVQAQKVLSAPAPSAASALSQAQLNELTEWFMRLLRRGMQPTLLTQQFLEATLPKPPAQGQADPSLTVLKQHLMAAIGIAFQPEQLTAQLAQAAMPPSLPTSSATPKP